MRYDKRPFWSQNDPTATLTRWRKGPKFRSAALPRNPSAWQPKVPMIEAGIIKLMVIAAIRYRSIRQTSAV